MGFSEDKVAAIQRVLEGFSGPYDITFEAVEAYENAPYLHWKAAGKDKEGYFIFSADSSLDFEVGTFAVKCSGKSFRDTLDVLGWALDEAFDLWEE
jgi:hypothetical protein